MLGALDEGQRRWLVGREALRLGRGGIQRMLEVSGLSKPTIVKGIKERHSRRALGGDGNRIRRRGGGRKPIEEHDPEVTDLLEQIMEESTVGDPMSPLKWSSKSSYQIQQYLESKGHRISEDTIQRRLRKLDYSLQANIKDKEGTSHAERDRQFRLPQRDREALSGGGRAGDFGRHQDEGTGGGIQESGPKMAEEGRGPEGADSRFFEPGKGDGHSLRSYDVYRNEGMVNVGMTHDTAEFAVESLRRWWRVFGRRHYAGARQVFICAYSA